MNTPKLLSLKLFSLLLVACVSLASEIPERVELKTTDGKTIRTRLAWKLNQQTQGVSGLKPKDFSQQEGMLFFYLRDEERSFWMPDTYFNLDIFYLNQKLEVIKIHRNVEHHPGRDNPAEIPRLPSVYCRHVLEMRTDSPIAKNIKPGDKLTWSSSPLLWKIERDIRQQQSR